MLQTLWHLFQRTIDATVAAMGTTRLGVIGGSVIPFLFVTLAQRPWKHGVWAAVKDLVRGVFATACVWAVIFCWQAVKIVYDNHVSLANTNEKLIRERDAYREQIETPTQVVPSRDAKRTPLEGSKSERPQKPSIQRATNTSVQFARPEPKSGFPFVTSTQTWLRATVTNHGVETAHLMRFTFLVDVVGRPPTPDIEEIVWKSTVAR